MVNEKLIILQENIYKTEEVRYLDNQELTTQKPTERNFFINCPDEDEEKFIAKAVMGAASAITGAFCPPAGAAIMVGGGLTGKAMESIGDNAGSGGEELKEAGKIISAGTEIGGGVGAGTGKVMEKAAENVVKEGFKGAVEEIVKNA